MKQMRNVLFVSLCIAMLVLVFGYNLFGASGAFEVQERSVIEGREYSKAPVFSAETLLNGNYQKQVEEFIADHVPMRDSVILGYAALQRFDIQTANIVFNWECYPSKLGSVFAVVPNHEAVMRIAPSPSESDLQSVVQWVASVNGVAAAYPDVQFVYDVIDDIYTSKYNPTKEYVSKTWSTDWIRVNVLEKLSNEIVVIYDPIGSAEEIYSQWFRTEYHWTLQRAIASFNRIGSILGWAEIPWEGAFSVTDTWYGSAARSGSDLQYADALYDIPADYAGLSCKINGEDGYRGLKEMFAKGVDAKLDFGNPPSNAFGVYYGDVKGETIWENSLNPSGGTCLFVEQSYGPPLEPYIAKNFARTVCIDPLNRKANKSFSEYIEQFDIDIVVIQLGINDLHKISENSPSWVK